MSITLNKSVVSTGTPTKNDVRDYFHGDPRIKGKKLKSYSVWLDLYASQSDDYTSYHNVYADHYDITATFE